MKRDFSPTVYLLASRRNGTLYVGVTLLIESENPDGRDLAEDFGFDPVNEDP